MWVEGHPGGWKGGPSLVLPLRGLALPWGLWPWPGPLTHAWHSGRSAYQRAVRCVLPRPCRAEASTLPPGGRWLRQARAPHSCPPGALVLHRSCATATARGAAGRHNTRGF